MERTLASRCGGTNTREASVKASSTGLQLGRQRADVTAVNPFMTCGRQSPQFGGL